MTQHDDEVGTIREALLAQGYHLGTQELPDGAFKAEAIPVGASRSGPGITFGGQTELEAARRVWSALRPKA